MFAVCRIEDTVPGSFQHMIFQTGVSIAANRLLVGEQRRSDFLVRVERNRCKFVGVNEVRFNAAIRHEWFEHDAAERQRAFYVIAHVPQIAEHICILRIKVIRSGAAAL